MTVRETLDLHVAIDRRVAIAEGASVPDVTVGAVLFADLAGFSRLTTDLLDASGERLGAEELTRALDTIYDALVESVHAFGGSVVSFSGDAITCVFDGDDGLRAVTAADAMHRACEAIRVSIGPEERSIAVKVGIAHGTVHRVAPGDPAIQRIDTLAGDPVLDAARAERHARPNETWLAPSAHGALASNVRIRELRAGGFAHVESLPKLAEPSPWPTPAPLDPSHTASFTLASLRDAIALGRATYLAELRTAVLVFVRFEGLRFGEDPDAHRALDAYVRWAQGVFDGFGGTLIGVNIGDKGSYLNGAFGAPTTHEDDASRAVAASLALLAPPESLSFLSDVAIGIGRGRMRAGTFGGRSRRTYAVLGRYGNLAARLMERAEPGQLLVDRAVRDADRGVHRFERVQEFAVKGQSTTVEAFACTGRAASRATPLDADGESDDSLIGRREHVFVFDRALEAPSSGGHGGLVLIVGEAGIGKTRVVRALAKRASDRGCSLIAVGGEALEQTSAYHAFRAAFHRVLDLDHLPDGEAERRAYVRERIAASPFARLAPLLAPVLPFAFPDDDVTAALAGEARADTTRELFTSLLLPSGDRASKVVLVDDAHHVDASSWALLARLRAERPDLVMVICTRPFEEGRAPREWQRFVESPGALHLPLGPLERDELAQLVARRSGAARVDDVILDFVVERAAGHPFFTEQLLRAVLEFGHAEVVGDRCVAKVDRRALETTDFPATVEGIVTSRLDRLPPRAGLALKIASVLGRSFDLPTVAALHPEAIPIEELHAIAKDLGTRDLLVAEPDGRTYAFRHAIVQRVAYDLMLFSQRRDLHRQAARIFEEGGRADDPAWFPILAHHHRLAESLDPAVVYLDRASEHAIRQGAYDEAIRFVRTLFEIDPDARRAPSVDRKARRLAILGDAEMNLGAIQESRRSLEGALAELGRPVPSSVVGVVGRAMVEAGSQMLHRYLPSLFSRPAHDAERQAFAAQILRDLQPVYFLHNALQHMLFATLRSVNLAEVSAGLTIAEQVRAEGYAAVALIASAVGAERIADAYRARAVRVGDALGEPTSLGQVWLLLALHSIGIGACTRALDEAGRARALFLEGSHRRRFEIACGTRGWASNYVGRFDDGLEAWNEVRVAALQRGDRQSLALAFTGHAETWLARGRREDLDAAHDAIEQALENLALEQDRMFEIHAMGLDAVVHGRRGEVDEAMPRFERAVRAMEATVPLSGYSMAAYVRPAEGLLDLVELGALPVDAPLVRRAVDGLAKYAGSFRVARARAWRARGRLAAARGDRSSARRAHKQSLAFAETLALPLDAALARYELARLGARDVGGLEPTVDALRALGLHHEPEHAARVRPR